MAESSAVLIAVSRAAWAAGPGDPQVLRAVVTLAITSGQLSGAATTVLGSASPYGRPPPRLLRGGLDHRHDAVADGLGQPIPGTHDEGEIGVQIVGCGQRVGK